MYGFVDNVLDQNQKKIFHTSSNFKVMKTRTLNNFVIIGMYLD